MTLQSNQDKDELIEELAAIEHQRWADWQRYVHKAYKDHMFILLFEKWERQINTPYAELSEKEKQSDRDQVMRYWPIIEARDSKLIQAVLGEIEASLEIDHNGNARSISVTKVKNGIARLKKKYGSSSLPGEEK